MSAESVTPLGERMIADMNASPIAIRSALRAIGQNSGACPQTHLGLSEGTAARSWSLSVA